MSHSRVHTCNRGFFYDKQQRGEGVNDAKQGRERVRGTAVSLTRGRACHGFSHLLLWHGSAQRLANEKTPVVVSVSSLVLSVSTSEDAPPCTPGRPIASPRRCCGMPEEGNADKRTRSSVGVTLLVWPLCACTFICDEKHTLTNTLHCISWLRVPCLWM